MCLVHFTGERTTSYASSAVPVGQHTRDGGEHVWDRLTPEDEALFYDLVVDLIVCGADWPA